MVNKDTLEELERLGFGADIDALESYVEQMQDAAGLGEPLVADSVYDQHVKVLKQLKPESTLLDRNWEVEDTEIGEYDKLLESYGMCSITSITNMKELDYFKDILKGLKNEIELIATIKENGHACRAVYVNGRLHSGTTRGRYKKGRDITRHLKAVLPNYVEQWKDIRLVEIRGEMLVSIDTFEKHLKGTLKTPLSSVTSLIRESVTDKELNLLDMKCFKILSDEDSKLKFNSLWDELEHLEMCGFNTPYKARIKGVTQDNLEDSVGALLKYFEELMDNGSLKYSTDGIVVAINDSKLFYSLGKNGNSWKANFAVKMGKYWESDIYVGIINDVVFTPGKSYMTPKAIIKPVITSNGSTVEVVPLYNIGVMERYNYLPGRVVYFRYGGEQGVTCCDENGDSVRVN